MPSGWASELVAPLAQAIKEMPVPHVQVDNHIELVDEPDPPQVVSFDRGTNGQIKSATIEAV